MSLSKAEGGMNLPNVNTYNIACSLRYSMDWITEQSTYSNWDLKMGMTKPWDLKALLHTPIKTLPPKLKNNFLIRDTIIALQMTRRALKLTTTMLRYVQIQHNPNSRQGQDHEAYKLWKDNGLRLFHQLLQDKTEQAKKRHLKLYK